MSWWKRLRKKEQMENRLDAELRYHFERQVADNIRDGMTEEQARRNARMQFGGLEQVKEDCRDVRGTLWAETTLQDVRFALRTFRKSPGFAAAAVVTLALGIGANATIFSAVNTVLFRPLAVKENGQLVFFNQGNSVNLSFPDYRDFRDRNDVLSGLTGSRAVPMNLSIRSGSNTRLWGYEATGNYFDMLGVQPLVGRLFHAEDDDKPGAHPVLVLSYRCWQRLFAGDPNVAGKTVKINGLDYNVLGVTPAEFNGTERILSPDLWVPMSMAPQIEPGSSWLENRGGTNIWVLGRLKLGVTHQQAEASLNLIAAQLAHDYPSADEGMKIQLSPPGLIGNALRGPVLGFVGVLMGVAGLVLLLACTNIAGMLLARASDRRKEIAVRLALGAGRTRLLRQLLTESILLAITGGAAGYVLSIWLADLFSSWRPPFDIPINNAVVPDIRVLLFAFCAALLATLLFGVAPALHATKADVAPALKGGATVERLRRWHLRDFLVGAQISLCVVLVISSVLVVRSLQHAVSLNLGFNPDHAVSVAFDLGLEGYSEQRGRALQQRLLERVSALPGVTAAGTINNMPLRIGMSMNGVSIVGRPLPPPSKRVAAVMYDISPGYLRAAGTRLLLGRDIDSHDGPQSPRVAVVNETFARKLLPGENAIGKRFRFGAQDSEPIEIVGVAEDGKYESLGEDPMLAVFESLAQHYNAWTTLVARTPLDPAEALRMIRGAATEADPALTLFNVGTLRDQLALPLFPARIAATILGAFGLLAAVLAATGVFALMAYAVSRRTREIGIRLALGARAVQVLALVFRRTLIVSIAGAAVGAAAALAVGGAFSAVLYGVSPRDPASYVLTLFLIVGVALLACWYPAHRVLGIDPARTLREE